jgi:hypothetical protein
MTEHAQGIRQHDTHRKLVSQSEQRKLDPRLTLDAVIVPASRSAENLEQAITLARAARSALVILCSHQMVPAEVHRLLAKRSFDDAIVVGLPKNYHHELLAFPALASIRDDLPAACSYYVTDLSTKRNVGLLLARMLGWQNIFFMDDDIRDIGHPDLQSTVSMLARYRTVGMRVNVFPDNSAVCHAHRATGGIQDVFITGAALAVSCLPDIGFFPDIYNEDWLFFYDDAARRQLGSSGRKVTQLKYDPFADPMRAAWQEFGDVMAEGLYALLDNGKGLEHATRDYWTQFLAARRSFLEAIRRRSATLSHEKAEPLLNSVEVALNCSVEIPPALFECYIRAWREDLRGWKQRYAGIPLMPSIEVALKELGLEQWVGGGAAGITPPVPGALSEEPPTKPYALLDLYDLLGSGAGAARRTMPGWGRRGASNGQVSILRHHRWPGAGEGGRVASTLRAFRVAGRGYPPTKPSPAQDTASGAPM